jgi:hypothetical protein
LVPYWHQNKRVPIGCHCLGAKEADILNIANELEKALSQNLELVKRALRVEEKISDKCKDA